VRSLHSPHPSRVPLRAMLSLVHAAARAASDRQLQQGSAHARGGREMTRASSRETQSYHNSLLRARVRTQLSR